MMMPKEYHYPMSPSRLSRQLACPKSYQWDVKAIEIEEEPSAAAQEGTLLHKVMEDHLKEHGPHSQIVNDDLTEEQLVICNECLDYLKTLVSKMPSASRTYEQEVSLALWDACLMEVQGVADVVIQHADELHIIDWKFGGGIFVSVEDNDQLLAYAAGAAINASGIAKIFIHVAQPRKDNWASRMYTLKELSQWVYGRLIPGVKAMLAESSIAIPGTTQCQWCPGALRCRARHNQATQAAAEVFAAYNAGHVSDEELAKTLRKAEVFNQYLSSIKKYAISTLLSGGTFPGFKLVSGRRSRYWTNEEKVSTYLMANLEVSQVYEAKLVTPPAAERRLKLSKKLDKTEFDKLVSYSEGKPTLVSDRDPRPAIEVKTAEEVFKNARQK